MKILLYFLLSGLITQSIIHPRAVQQIFKRVFNISHVICPSASTDSMGKLDLKPYLNAQANWAAVTSHWGKINKARF